MTQDESQVIDTLSVSQFLDGLNVELSGMAARIRGEVSSVDQRERVVYFTLKDAQDGSTLHCLIFRYQYAISGVGLAVGDEIIVEGAPDIYKPSGRLSLKVSVMELCGEGALKKSYDALKLKLEQAGLFAPERKRTLPPFPERIALITSEQGAAIGDFQMNLGTNGFRVDFYPVSVEGKKAVLEIMEAINFFQRRPEQYDVLVIVRGGGSLESLQAFNNEALTRAVAESRIPTLLGIGHEKDITLASLAADVAVSTPTAAAQRLRHPWDEARQMVNHFRYQLPILFRERLADARNIITLESETLLAHLRAFSELVGALQKDIFERFIFVQSATRQKLMDFDQADESLARGFVTLKERFLRTLTNYEERLHQYDPKQALQLGYSLIRKGGKIIKDVSETAIGDILDVQLSRGKLRTKVEKIIQ
jgi:exodeoxyribonuclease VII large subunit